MNILLYVVAMILLLSFMTYARLDVYQAKERLSRPFLKALEGTEQGYYTKRAQQCYDKIKVATKEGSDTKPINASRKIPWSLLFDNKKIDEQSQNAVKILSVRLIHKLYDNFPFFQKVLKDHPSAVEDLLQALQKNIEELPEDKRPKKTPELANVDLHNPFLNDLLYQLLKGKTSTDLSEGEGEGEVPEPTDASQPNSFLDYITLENKPQIRLFLTPAPILLALYQDGSIVGEIMNERKELYLRLNRDSNFTKEAATELFTNRFKGRLPESFETLINFDVTKTKPPQTL